MLITSYDLEKRDSWFLARHKAHEDARPMTSRWASCAGHVSRADLLPAGTALLPRRPRWSTEVFTNNPAMCA